MTCPACGNRNTSVLETRRRPVGTDVERRHRCSCGARWASMQRLVRGSLSTTGSLPVVTGGPTGSPPVAYPPPTGDPPVAYPPPAGSVGGVGGALPSDPIRTYPDPDLSKPIQSDYNLNGQEPPPSLTFRGLVEAWARVRADVFGGVPWATLTDPRGETATFAEGLPPEAAKYIRSTMRLACEHIRDGHEDWRDPLMRKSAYAFGAWKAKFSDLCDEISGAAPRPTNGARERDPYYEEL